MQPGKMKLLKALFIASIVVFIFLLSFRIAFFDDDYYKEKFRINNAYEKYGEENVNNANEELNAYLTGSGELKTDFFNEREKLHLKDVKDLIWNVFFVFYAILFLLVILLCYFIISKKIKIIWESLYTSGLISFGVVAVFLLVSILNFNWLFTWFHLLSFNNELWLLPRDSRLVNMFPSDFFSGMFTRILVYSGLIGIGLIIAGWVIRKFAGKVRMVTK